MAPPPPPPESPALTQSQPLTQTQRDDPEMILKSLTMLSDLVILFPFSPYTIKLNMLNNFFIVIYHPHVFPQIPKLKIKYHLKYKTYYFINQTISDEKSGHRRAERDFADFTGRIHRPVDQVNIC